MAEGIVLIVGGTQGMGRELASHYLERGREVVITGRDEGKCQSVAGELGGKASGIGFDLAQPETIAGALAEVGPVDKLVLCAIARDNNPIREYDVPSAISLATMKLVGYSEVIHTLLDRMSDDSAVVLFGGRAKDRPYPGSTTVTAVNGAVSTMITTFAGDPAADASGNERVRALVRTGRAWAAFDRGNVVATAGTFEQDVSMPGGGTLTMAGLTMVTVRPTHRRRGILHALIEEHLADARRRGADHFPRRLCLYLGHAAAPAAACAGGEGRMSHGTALGACRALIVRDLALLWRRRGDALNPALFAVMVIMLFPFALGPEPQMLGRIAAGTVLVALLLAGLLSLDALFRSDLEDGSLEQLVLSPHPLPLLLACKIAVHWLTTALPLLLAAPLLGELLFLPPQVLGTLMAALALSTPLLSLIGAVCVALTVGMRRSGMLLALLVLPLYVPVLIFAAGACDAAQQGLPVAAPLLWALQHVLLYAYASHYCSVGSGAEWIHWLLPAVNLAALAGASLALVLALRNLHHTRDEHEQGDQGDRDRGAQQRPAAPQGRHREHPGRHHGAVPVRVSRSRRTDGDRVGSSVSRQGGRRGCLRHLVPDLPRRGAGAGPTLSQVPRPRARDRRAGLRGLRRYRGGSAAGAALSREVRHPLHPAARGDQRHRGRGRHRRRRP